MWVFNILNSESDETRPITQTKIAKIISEVYPCDRKTVCRNIKALQKMGYPIKKTPKGFYIEGRTVSNREVDFVKSAILSAEGKSEEEKAALAEKIGAILTKMIAR